MSGPLPLNPQGFAALQAIVEKLRLASVQHGAHIKQLIQDVGTVGHQLAAVHEKQAALDKEAAEAHEAFQLLVGDVQKLAEGAGVAAAEGSEKADSGSESEADVSYDDEEEEAEYAA